MAQIVQQNSAPAKTSSQVTPQTQKIQNTSTAQPVQIQSQTIPPPKGSVFKKWWFWLIILIGILIIGFAVWYLFF